PYKKFGFLDFWIRLMSRSRVRCPARCVSDAPYDAFALRRFGIESRRLIHVWRSDMHLSVSSKMGKLVFAIAIGFSSMIFTSDSAWAQGCVVARQATSPVLPETVNISGTANFNAAGESWWSPRRWELTVDYRYLHSHRHFVGTEEQTQREAQHTEVNNIIHIVDIAATYEFTPRASITVDIPVFLAHRFSENTPNQVTHGNGIGDLSLVGRAWLLRPPAENRGNVSFGLGVKFPTGKPDVSDTVNTPNG